MTIPGNREVAASQPPPPGRRCPWLVYYHGKGYKKQSFCYDITGPSPVKTHIKSIPVLRDKKVLSCAHGRLVLYDYNAKSLSLCNSTTFDNTLILPDLHHLWNHKIDSCVLLLLPPGGNLTLLIFLEELPSIMLCGVGETKWSEISYGKYLEPFFVEELHTIARENGSPLFFRRAVGFGGKVYAQLGADWLDGFCYSMMSIEIVEEGAAEFGLVLRTVNGPADMRSGCFTPYINVYMLESCGELFLIHFSSGALVFEVYRMNFDTMAWERMKSIKDATFFIGENYCFSCPTSGSGDRIYFTRRKDHRLYCYNMEDGSVVMSSPRPAIPTPWPSPPIWMMPQLTLSIKQESEHINHDCNINNQRRRSIVISKMELSEKTDGCIQLCDLPYDLLEHFSKHLIAIDYMNFRATSKISQSVCPPINWRIALSGVEKNDCFTSPLLMFPDRHESVYKFLDPSVNCNGNNYYFMRMPDSFGSHIIRYCNEGWVLLSKSGSGVNLYNPFKRDIITYNYSHTRIEDCLFFVGKPPGSMHPICIDFCDGIHVFVSINFEPGEDWSRDELTSEKNFDAAMQTSPVLFNDAFYYLDKMGRLGYLEIDLQLVNIRWEVLEKPQRPADLKFFSHNFLVECGGELISVFLGRAGKWVYVYKLNNNHQAWEKVSNLGGYDLYLNPTSSSAMPSSSGGNRIYFPLLRGTNIVYFSMETGKWHFSGSQQDSSSHLYGTRWYPNSCWIKPCW
ncbi:unnamed protein product [Cuscuta campestris]|uniref:KIB1-4 beta-propeller domain-containing protein n=1 Tax=Cuscuta campestris TaxID=132261 RepID=A0A484L686_9ASTE|nr:unnamed protein product [Cuscuta campestris]